MYPIHNKDKIKRWNLNIHFCLTLMNCSQEQLFKENVFLFRLFFLLLLSYSNFLSSPYFGTNCSQIWSAFLADNNVSLTMNCDPQNKGHCRDVINCEKLKCAKVWHIYSLASKIIRWYQTPVLVAGSRRWGQV